MNRLTLLIVALALFAALALGGCATIFNTPEDTISIETFPPGASVKIKNQNACERTPCQISLPNNTFWRLTIEKEGFKDAEVLLGRSTNYWWLVPDLMFGGVFAVLLDVMTESMHQLTPDNVRVGLVEIGQPGQSLMLAPPTSLELRLDRELELLGGVLFREAIGAGFSFTGGFYLSPDIILEGTADLSFSLAGPNHFAQVNERFGLQLKAFLGNSLFVVFGVGMQNIEETMELDFGDLNNATESSFRVSYRELGGIVAIGNQWQYNSFTASVNWLDLFFPLQHNRLAITDDAFSLSEAAAQRSDADAFLQKDLFPSFRVFHLQLGASF